MVCPSGSWLWGRPFELWPHSVLICGDPLWVFTGAGPVGSPVGSEAPVLSVPAALQTVVGTDIAELLLQDHRTVWLPGKSPNEANLIDFTNEALDQAEEEESGEAQLSFLTDSQATTTNTLEKETERFRELLLYGRKKVSPRAPGHRGSGTASTRCG